MKYIMIAVAALSLFSSCTQVAGWFGSNPDSTGGNNVDSNSYAAFARDESITSANSYSNLFLDSNSIEKFITNADVNDSNAVALRSFYRVRNYQYAWFSTDGPTEQARSLWSLNASKKAQGTKNSIEALNERMDSLLQSDSISIANNDSSFIKTELELTQQLIQYAGDNPQHITRHAIYHLVPAKKIDAMSYADSIINGKKESSLYANNKAYTQLRQQLANYYAIAKNGGWGTISKGQLKKGTKSPAVVALKKRLQATHDYSGTDTNNIFSDSLTAAVTSFQLRNGLKPTGVVNDSMINALNIHAEQRIQQIIVNMNRSLWQPEQKDSSYIMVNIPSQTLYAYSDSGKMLEMPVIVGKEGDGTVMFSSQINQIVFNPTWNIPESMVRDEIMPKMKADASYLKKHNIEIVKQSDSIPVLRQLPGKENPLGKMKFLFPNTHDIYLHDTPNKELFAKTDRALSHGCIRVADAVKLAEYLLHDQKNWDRQKITAAINSGKQQTVEIKSQPKVAITYLTAWVDDTGAINFRNDIYGHDAEAMQKLFVVTA